MLTSKFAAFNDAAIFGTGLTTELAVADAAQWLNPEDVVRFQETCKTAIMTYELAKTVAESGGNTTFGLLSDGRLGTMAQVENENEITVLLDNGGSVTLQVTNSIGSQYQHTYDEATDQIVNDIALALAGENPVEWDGNDLDIDDGVKFTRPSSDDIQNGGYEVFEVGSWDDLLALSPGGRTKNRLAKEVRTFLKNAPISIRLDQKINGAWRIVTYHSTPDAAMGYCKTKMDADAPDEYTVNIAIDEDFGNRWYVVFPGHGDDSGSWTDTEGAGDPDSWIARENVDELSVSNDAYSADY